MTHDTRHGGPYDRGAADYWYARPYNPHYFTGGTHTSQLVTNLTPQEIEAYTAGYEAQAEDGGQKIWG